MGCSDGEDPSATTSGTGGSGAGDGTGGAGGQGGEGGAEARPFDWGLPPGFPRPKVPEDNPMSVVKVELGRRLFYDPRLSGTGDFSCASCHRQELAFTDGLARSVGSTGEVHPRGSMSLVNTGFLSALTWANPLLDSLEKQALVPMFGEDPVELGLAGKEVELMERLGAEPLYQELFPAAFPGEDEPLQLKNLTRALAAFQRSILSYRSPFDRYTYGGDPTAMSTSALRGKDLFFSEQMECFHCHGGFNFSDSVMHDGSTFTELMFHNTGLYNIGGTGAYPEGNTGLREITGLAMDMGRFRAPTLRNIAVTAPYMHDGSVTTLDEALDHYGSGGRTIASGPHAGVGNENPYKSELLVGFTLTPQERQDVKAFLESLTDDALLTDPRLSDPWVETP
ncbi:methanobactin export MATE transporter MbnM [Chondromyces crocatus]